MQLKRVCGVCAHRAILVIFVLHGMRVAYGAYFSIRLEAAA
jgi:hypothetical protein